MTVYEQAQIRFLPIGCFYGFRQVPSDRWQSKRNWSCSPTVDPSCRLVAVRQRPTLITRTTWWAFLWKWAETWWTDASTRWNSTRQELRSWVTAQRVLSNRKVPHRGWSIRRTDRHGKENRIHKRQPLHTWHSSDCAVPLLKNGKRIFWAHRPSRQTSQSTTPYHPVEGRGSRAAACERLHIKIRKQLHVFLCLLCYIITLGLSTLHFSCESRETITYTHVVFFFSNASPEFAYLVSPPPWKEFNLLIVGKIIAF